MKFDWSGYHIENINEKHCLMTLNMMKSNYQIMRQCITQNIVENYLNSILILEYQFGKLTLFENTFQTSIEGYNKISPDLKILLKNNYVFEGNFMIFTLSLEESFYIKLKYESDIVENLTNNKKIIVEKF